MPSKREPAEDPLVVYRREHPGPGKYPQWVFTKRARLGFCNCAAAYCLAHRSTTSHYADVDGKLIYLGKGPKALEKLDELDRLHNSDRRRLRKRHRRR